MLAKPMRFAIGCFFAVKSQKHNGVCTPKPCQVNCLVSTAATLMDAAVTPEAFFVLAADPVYAEVFLGAVVLGPALAFELPFDCFAVDFPPVVVTGVEDFCESGFSPGVVDGDG